MLTGHSAIGVAIALLVASLLVFEAAALPFKGPTPTCDNLSDEQRKSMPSPNITKAAMELAGISDSKWLPHLDGRGSRDDLLQLVAQAGGKADQLVFDPFSCFTSAGCGQSLDNATLPAYVHFSLPNKFSFSLIEMVS
jgi:hypothetical protein